jgi:Protein of unknown function (DUF3443)
MTMMHRRFGWLAAVPFFAIACGGSSGGDQFTGSDGGANDGGTTGDDGSPTSPDGGSTVNNVAPVIVNGGPPGIDPTSDVPFITVTVCIPGTSTCQDIDFVSVDTGSSGTRIISTALNSNIVLPQAMATTGSPLAECLQFDDGYSWGSVRYADIKIGGETAAHIPIEIIGDSAFPTVPADCASSGPPEDTAAEFGGYGIIGINQIIPDCGDYCSDTSNPGTGAYYSCSGGTCTAVAVADTDQVSNPIASFTQDNNGAVLQFPSVPAEGATTLSGSLIFGIGTQANNALGSATVQTVDGEGNFTTIFNGTTLSGSYIDSGTSLLSFDDASIAQCSDQDLSGFYCPASPLMLMAQNKGQNGATTTVSFSVESASTLYENASYEAFSDLAGPEGGDGLFAWGFPFFIGRSVFIGLDGASTPGGNGPYVAY